MLNRNRNILFLFIRIFFGTACKAWNELLFYIKKLTDSEDYDDFSDIFFGIKKFKQILD